jgi:hypothetical protein
MDDFFQIKHLKTASLVKENSHTNEDFFVVKSATDSRILDCKWHEIKADHFRRLNCRELIIK